MSGGWVGDKPRAGPLPPAFVDMQIARTASLQTGKEPSKGKGEGGFFPQVGPRRPVEVGWWRLWTEGQLGGRPGHTQAKEECMEGDPRGVRTLFSSRENGRVSEDATRAPTSGPIA